MSVIETLHRLRTILCSSVLAFLFLASSSPLAQEIIQRKPGLFVTSQIVKELPRLPQNRLTIQSASSLSGILTIEVSDNPGLKVTYIKKARTAQRSRAFDYIDLISVNLSEAGDRAKMIIRAPNPGPWETWSESGLVDAVITVPKGCFVLIEAAAFDVKATGPLSGLVIPSSLGRITVSNISGLLQVKTANQKISLENISGEISAVTSNSQLFARSIKAPEKTARFRNSQGEIKIIDFEGSLKVRNKLGRIEILRLIPTGEGNFISGSSAPISVDILTMRYGQIVINNRDEDIEISVPDNLSAFYFFTVGDNGSIDATSLPVRTELVRSGRLNLVSGEGGVNISGSIRGEGNIYLRGKEPE